MFLIEFLPPRRHPLRDLARQMGISHAVIKAAPELTGRPPPYERGILELLQRDLAAAGITLLGLEGDPFDMSRIKLGLPGRDEDIERYRAMLREMGRLGLRLLCYNFMAGVGWHRSSTTLPGRGGAHVTAFDVADEGPHGAAREDMSSQRIRENLHYFLSHVLPVAEEASVRLGAHPDDPPLAHVRGVGRTLNTPENINEVLSWRDRHSHGLTFCVANWKLMCDADLDRTVAHARRHAAAGRVNFVHLRHVEGTRERFRETFHDEGAEEMVALVRALHEAGFRGPLRCDHVPTLATEDPAGHVPGYGTLGRLFADGYLLGLLDALGARTSPEAWLNA